jgi:hypothetical protein
MGSLTTGEIAAHSTTLRAGFIRFAGRNDVRNPRNKLWGLTSKESRQAGMLFHAGFRVKPGMTEIGVNHGTLLLVFVRFFLRFNF